MDRVRVERLDFTLIYKPAGDDLETAGTHTVNIVFVHGLRGNPKSTWEYVVSPPPTDPSLSESPSKRRKLLAETFQNLSCSKQGSDIPPDSGPSLAPKSNSGGVQQKIYWPADVLPHKVPNARIWTYGYNADVYEGLFGSVNRNSILYHANDFMVKLPRALEDDKPIIFVAHSLGGILVKRALSLMESSLSSNHYRLLSRVSAVVFCGCPHRGADAARWGLLANKLIRVAFADSNPKLLADLDTKSEVLELIQTDFLMTLERNSFSPSFRVHTFVEGRAMSGISGLDDKVVDDKSSRLGWAREMWETIDADHREMVRGPGVRSISSVLRKLAQNVNVSEEWRLSEKERLIQYQPFKHLHMFFTIDYHAILSQVPKRFPSTCSWILETDAFRRWAHGEKTSVLWLRGYPGLGKSVIAKYLVEEVLGADWTSPPVRNTSRNDRDDYDEYDDRNDRNDPLVVFFFCTYRDGQARSLKSLLSSLLHQLIYQRPELSLGIQVRYESLSQSLTESIWSLWKMLEDVIFKISRVSPMAVTPEVIVVPPPKNLYIVVDALDELPRAEQGPFCDRFFQILKRNGNPFRLVITSRKEPDLERQLAGAWCLDLNSTNQNASDVAEYLKTSVSTYGMENNFGGTIIQTITSELTRRANGMFLWASLAWSFFTEGVGTWTRAVLQQRLQALQHLPPGMDSLYHRILASIDTRVHTELQQALQWVVAAFRPLTIDEIAVALALRERPRSKRNIDTRLNIKAFLKKTCPHLIRIDDHGAVLLVHVSFKDYLLETLEIKNETELVPNTFHINLTEVNLNIGLDCLSYVVLNDFAKNSLAVVSQENELFSYACLNWLGHLAGRNDRVSDIWVHFIKLIDRETKLLRWYDTTEVIIELWTNNLSGLFEPAVRIGMDLNVVDKQGDHFIHRVVSEIGRFPLESVKFLTGLGLSINGRTHSDQTLLHRCISGLQDELASLLHDEAEEDSMKSDTERFELCSTKRTLCDLLSFPDIDPNVMDKFGYTPLSFAIHEGLEKAVATILACPHLDMVKGFAALRVAAKEGVSSAVESLLNQGVDVSEKTNFGETALHLAASNGHLQVLQLLAEKCPNHVLNAKDVNGWTVVHRAVTSGNDELVLWLIQQTKFNLDLRDKHGRRAIAFAAAYGTKTMLDACLKKRPDDISHLDSFGNTLFHMAAVGGNQQTFSFLYSLHEQGRVARPGANRWGKTVVDLAPTLEFEEHLHKLGYAPSEWYLSHQHALSILNSQARVAETNPTGGSDTCRETGRHSATDSPDRNSTDDSRDSTAEGEEKAATSSEPDRLGRRFNSIYAID